MGSLTNCIRKAGKALDEKDAKAIKALRDDLKDDGVPAQEAAVQAAAMYLGDLKTERNALAEAIGDAAQADYLPMLANYNKYRGDPGRQDSPTSTAPEHANKAVNAPAKYPMPEKITSDRQYYIEGEMPFLSAEQFAEVTGEFEWLFPEPKKSDRLLLARSDSKGPLGKADMSEDGRFYVGPGNGVYVTAKEAKAKQQEWKDLAASQHPENRSDPITVADGVTHYPGRGSNSDKVVLSLFDLTGNWVQPYVDAGYDVYLFDLQNGQDVMDFSAEYFNSEFNFDDIFAIVAACPCTEFTAAGNRWKGDKAKADANYMDSSKELVYQTLRTIEYFRPQVWAIENPMGSIRTKTGLPMHRMAFHPHHFGDDYTKTTWMYGNFNAQLETANLPPVRGSKMANEFGGKGIATKNARSETPSGFAYSFFASNNALTMSTETYLTTKYTNVQGAITAALDAGLSEEQIKNVMDNYWDFDGGEAAQVLYEVVAGTHGFAHLDEDLFAEQIDQQDEPDVDSGSAVSSEPELGEKIERWIHIPNQSIVRDASGTEFVYNGRGISLDVVLEPIAGGEDVVLQYDTLDQADDYYINGEMLIDGEITVPNESHKEYWLNVQMAMRIQAYEQLGTHRMASEDPVRKSTMLPSGRGKRPLNSKEKQIYYKRIGNALEKHYGLKIAATKRLDAIEAIEGVKEMFSVNAEAILAADALLEDSSLDFAGAYTGSKEYDPRNMSADQKADYWLAKAQKLVSGQKAKHLRKDDVAGNVRIVANVIYNRLDRAIPEEYSRAFEKVSELTTARWAHLDDMQADESIGPDDQLSDQGGLFRKSDEPTKTEINGDLKRVDPNIRKALNSLMKRKSPQEAARIRDNLNKFTATPWAVTAIKGLALREFFHLATDGKGDGAQAQQILDSDIWGKQNMRANKVVKAFLKGDSAAVLRELRMYDILTDNAKAETSISTSMGNCNPSKACATHCYAAKGNLATPGSVIKSEFLEWGAEHYPAEFAEMLALEFKATYPGQAGLALRLNDKGDLSPAQVALSHAMKDEGVRMQIFSKRPELLRQTDKFHLRMLSVDGTNLNVANENPDLQLAITLTEDVKDSDLVKIASRAAVILPINMQGKDWSMRELRDRWPQSYKMFKDAICPVEAGVTEVGAGTSYLQITEVKSAPRGKKGKRLWTCTSCDKLGTMGCYHGSNQTQVARHELLASSEPAENEKITAINQIRLELAKLEKIGGISREQSKQILGEIREAGGTVSRPDNTGAAQERGEGGGQEGGDNSQGRGRGAARSPAGTSQQLSPADVESALDGVRQSWAAAPPITVVQSPSDLPADVQDEMRRQGADMVAGYFDRGNQQIYLVADGIKDKHDAQVTLLHEAVGHYGIESIMGRDGIGRFLREVEGAKQRDPKIREAYEYVDRVYAGAPPIVRAAEVVAKISEADPKHNIVQRIFQMLRQMLRRAGFNIPFTSSDLTEALRRSKSNLKTGKYQHSGGEGGLFQSAYHGSPYQHDRFSTQHIGSGEGNQAYGWGLYFAQRQDVAEYYRDMLSGEEGTRQIYVDGKHHSNYSPMHGGDFSEAMNMIENHGSPEEALDVIDLFVSRGADPDTWKYVSAKLEDLAGKSVTFREAEGALYKVDLPEDHELLDWEMKLRDQPFGVQQAIAAAPDANMDLTGEEFYENLTNLFDSGVGVSDDYGNIFEPTGDSQRDASEYLKSLGVPGLRYFDERSRNQAPDVPEFTSWAGYYKGVDFATLSPAHLRELRAEYDEFVNAEDTRTRNYVIFDEERIAITDKLFRLEDQVDMFADPEPAAVAGKLTPAEIQEWRAAHKVSQRQGRIPAVQAAAQGLESGELSSAQYRETVKKYMPIMPIEDVPELTTVEDMSAALATNKAENILGVDREIADGTRVASRLDIPAYDFYDTWVVTIHDGSVKGGKSIAYGSAAVMDNVEFATSPKAALGIASGSKAKSPFARIHGDWKDVSPEEAHALASRVMNDPAWTQVGMNPFRHSYFYEKSTGRPVVGAEQAVQIGPLVMAKNVERADPEDEQFRVKGTDIFFRIADDQPTSRENVNRRIREEHKGIWFKAKSYAQRQFTPGGLLPRSVFDAKIKRDSKMGAVEMDVKEKVWALELAYKKDFGRSFDRRSAAEELLMDRALRGDVEAMGELPDATVVALEAMRQYIDRQSERYIEILRQDGINMLSELDEGRREEFLAQIAAGDLDGLSGPEAVIAQKLLLMQTIMGNVGEYLHRSYRAFDDKLWPRNVPESVLNDARDYLVSRYLEDNLGASEQEADDAATRVIEEILKKDTAFDSMESFIQESKLGAKDLSLLKRRKVISPEIRALLGEHKDTRLNFAKTATKMTRLIFNDSFLKHIREVGMGEFLFEPGTQPQGSYAEIAGEGSKVLEPLNGLKTTPEIAQAFTDALGRENMAAWFKMVVQANGMVKFGKTVLSPTTAARNWMSALFFTLGNGHFDLREMSKSLKSMRAYFKHQGDELAYLRKLKELGVVYDTPYAGEMMRLLDDTDMADRLLDGRMHARHALTMAQRAYQFGDDFWKIIGFENEVALQMKYRNLSRADAEILAAERIRNAYPTYSMVGRAVNQLRRFPLAGTFVSFPAEIVRTSFNMLKYAAEDMKHSKALGARRVAGLALVGGLAYAAQEMSKNMLGVDDDEEEAVREQLPEWSRNSNLYFLSRDDGNLRYIDLSFLDPYNYWKRPITAIMRDEPFKDKAQSAASDMLSPFFGTDIAFGSIAEVWNNKKGSGGRVYNEADTGPEQAIAIADHLRKALQPGAAANLERILKAARDERSATGRQYAMNDEMAALAGFRVSTLDPGVSLKYRTFEASDQLRNASGILSRQARDPNPVSEEDLRETFDRVEEIRAETYSDLLKSIKAARKSGMDNQAVIRQLRAGGMSKRDSLALAHGRLPRKVMSPQYMRNVVRSAGDTFGADIKQQIEARRRLIMRWSRER